MLAENKVKKVQVSKVCRVRLMKCKDCNIYTLEMNCPGCGHSTVVPEPARFSVDDRFGIYRRGLKFKT